MSFESACRRRRGFAAPTSPLSEGRAPPTAAKHGSDAPKARPIRASAKSQISRLSREESGLALADAELADDRERLRRERLVQLDEVECGGVDADPAEELAHRGHGANAHHARTDAGDGAADERAERLDPQVPRLLLGRDDERRGAVVDPGRVAGSDRAARAEGR